MRGTDDTQTTMFPSSRRRAVAPDHPSAANQGDGDVESVADDETDAQLYRTHSISHSRRSGALPRRCQTGRNSAGSSGTLRDANHRNGGQALVSKGVFDGSTPAASTIQRAVRR